MTADKPRVEILYCPKCGWLLRAAWMAQELLTTFADDLLEVALVPSPPGTYVVRVAAVELWNRSSDGGFPEPKVLKQRLRDACFPGRDLGHSDRG